MATEAQKKALTALYAGYFDRAPDPAGLQFWINQIDNGRAFNTIAADFAASAEATALYPYLTAPDVATSSTFITSVYQNLFNRAPDAEGLAFWKGVLEAKSVSVADMIEAIINGAKDAPTATPATFDKATLDNKVEAGLDFAVDAGNTSGFTYDADAKVAATAAIAGVTNDPATVTAAKAATDAYLTGSATVGQTLTLTTGVDSPVGTEQDDTINATLSATATEQTLNTGDIITGKGGNDTLKILANGSTGTPLAQTAGVENVEVRAVANTTVSQQLMNGVQKVASENSNANLTVASANLDTTYALNNTVAGTTAGLTVNYSSVAGTSDTAKLSVNNAGNKAGAVTTTQTVDVANGNAVEAVTLATAGTNYVNLNAGTGAKTITVTGAGVNDLTVGSANTALTLDASASTGANTLRVGTQLSGASDKVVGGTAADTLVASIGSTTVADISAVETLDLNFTASALFNASKTTGVEKLDIANQGTAASFSNLVATADEIVFDTSAGGGGATLGYASGASSDLAVSVGKVTAAGTSTDSVGVGGLTISGNAGKVAISSVADKAATVNTTGAVALGTATGLTVDAASAAITVGNVTGTAAKDLSLNATKGAVTVGTFAAADALATVSMNALAGNVATGLISADDSLSTISLNAGATGATDHSITTSFGKSGTAGAKDVNATLTATGEGDITVSTAADATYIGTVDASAATGSTSFDFSNYTGNKSFTITLGNAATGEANTATLSTTAGASVITGGTGVDNITGGGAADVLDGGAGNDVIKGGGGADVITAGAGADVITGGDGQDVITLGSDSAADDVILSNDVAGNQSDISGFELANDQIIFDESEFATINFAATGAAGDLAAADYNEAAAAAMTFEADHVNIITDAAGFASYDAAFAASTAGVAGEAFVGFLNSTSGKFEMYFDADISDDAGEVLVASVDIVGASVATLSEANFGVV